MPPLHSWLGFVLAAEILLLIPGPTVLMLIGCALRHGRRATLSAVPGVVAGDALAMSASLLGLGVVLAASATLFEALKWLGALYLIYLGVSQWRAPPVALPGTVVDPRRLRRRAFTVTALNPKSIAFFVAFMPQFVSTDGAALTQLVVLGTTFLVLAGANATGYALAAGSLQELLSGTRARRRLNRTGGAVLVTAGVVMATLSRARAG